jgi:hypothetical protein
MNKWRTVIPYLGWRKSDSQANRRKAVLSAKKGDCLASSRALIYFASNSNDPEVKKKALGDARYFRGRAKRQRK